MNINTFGPWINNNQGILAVILFIATFLVSFIIWLFKKIFSKKQKRSTSSPKNPAVKSLINAGRDINVGRDIIGEQHNITNNSYNSPKNKKFNQSKTINFPRPLGSEI